MAMYSTGPIDTVASFCSSTLTIMTPGWHQDAPSSSTIAADETARPGVHRIASRDAGDSGVARVSGRQPPGPKSRVIQRSSGLTGVVRAPSRTLAEPGASSGSGGASWARVKAISLGPPRPWARACCSMYA